MHPEALLTRLIALEELLLDVGDTGGSHDRRQHVLEGEDAVEDLARGDPPLPADSERRPEPAFPPQPLLAPERRGPTVGPAELLRAVVGGEDDHGVVGDAQIVELIQKLSDDPVELGHAVGVDAESGLVLPSLRKVRPHVHPGGVVPQQERLLGVMGAVDEVERTLQQVVFPCLHALAGQGASVLDRLLADPSESRVLRGVVDVAGPAVKDPTRDEELLKDRQILRVVRLLGLLLRVEVVEVAVELVEAMHGRQELVAVTQMVLAVLGRHVAQGLEQLGQGRVFGLEPLLGTRQSDGRQSRAHRDLPGDERRAPRRATGLRVGIGQHRTLGSEAIYARRLGAHQPTVVGTHIKPTDVIRQDQEHVRLVCGHGCRSFSEGWRRAWSGRPPVDASPTRYADVNWLPLWDPNATAASSRVGEPQPANATRFAPSTPAPAPTLLPCPASVAAATGSGDLWGDEKEVARSRFRSPSPAFAHLPEGAPSGPTSRQCQQTPR